MLTKANNQMFPAFSLSLSLSLSLLLIIKKKKKFSFGMWYFFFLRLWVLFSHFSSLTVLFVLNVRLQCVAIANQLKVSANRVIFLFIVFFHSFLNFLFFFIAERHSREFSGLLRKQKQVQWYTCCTCCTCCRMFFFLLPINRVSLDITMILG